MCIKYVGPLAAPSWRIKDRSGVWFLQWLNYLNLGRFSRISRAINKKHLQLATISYSDQIGFFTEGLNLCHCGAVLDGKPRTRARQDFLDVFKCEPAESV